MSSEAIELRNLTNDVRTGREIGVQSDRQSDIDQVLSALARRDRHSVVLVTEPGIEADSVVRGVAVAMASGNTRHDLARTDIYELPFTPLSGDDSPYQGESQLASQVRLVAHSDSILLIADYTLLYEPSADASVLAKSVRDHVANGMRAIVVVPEDHYRAALRRTALGRRFEPLKLTATSKTQAINLLKGLRDSYEAHHRIQIPDAAIVAAVTLSDHFADDRDLFASAQSVIDSACSQVEMLLADRDPEIGKLDSRIQVARHEKETASEDADFERAAAYRDEEKQLEATRRKLLDRWLIGDSPGSKLTEEMVVNAVAHRTGVKPNTLRAALADERLRGQAVSAEVVDYRLINDRPASAVSDLLQSNMAARSLARIVRRSWASSPFVLAVDGGWGSGKSTLLGLIAQELGRPQSGDAASGQPEVHAVEFNAWTAERGESLEGLIKSVLVKLDPNLVRRYARLVIRNSHASTIARVVSTVLANFVGVGRLVDQMWNHGGGDDPALRNDLRNTIGSLLKDWAGASPTEPLTRVLVVFVDDLDRCSDEGVIGICEAVKLYLDSPGIIFVLGCDLTRVADAVGSHAGGRPEGHAYLEKIVQIVHRVSMPDKVGTRALVAGYAAASRTEHLFDPEIVDLLVDQTDRNPRRIKRIINGFVLESYLNSSWQTRPLGSSRLLIAILLQHLYPDFYRSLVAHPSSNDSIADFIDYAAFKEAAADTPPREDPWWRAASRVMQRNGGALPERNAGLDLSDLVRRVEHNLPPTFPALARNTQFVMLLRRIGSSDSRMALQNLLVSQPLSDNQTVDVSSDGATSI